MCRGAFFSISIFFSLPCVWGTGYSASLISGLYSYRFELVWFGGWDWLLVLEKKQLSYIILFVCIWSEHILPQCFCSFCLCLCLCPKKKRIRKSFINFVIFIYLYINIYIIAIYLVMFIVNIYI